MKPITYNPSKGIRAELPCHLNGEETNIVQHAIVNYSYLMANGKDRTFTFSELAEVIEKTYDKANPRIEAIIKTLNKADRRV